MTDKTQNLRTFYAIEATLYEVTANVDARGQIVDRMAAPHEVVVGFYLAEFAPLSHAITCMHELQEKARSFTAHFERGRIGAEPVSKSRTRTPKTPSKLPETKP